VGVSALDDADGFVDGVRGRHLALVKDLHPVEPSLAVLADLRRAHDRVHDDVGIVLSAVQDGIVAGLLVALHCFVESWVDLQGELVERLGVLPAILRQERAAELHAAAEDLVRLGAVLCLVAHPERRLPRQVRPAAGRAELHDEDRAVGFELGNLCTTTVAGARGERNVMWSRRVRDRGLLIVCVCARLLAVEGLQRTHKQGEREGTYIILRYLH